MNYDPANTQEELPKSSYFVRKYLRGIFLVIGLIILSVFWGFSYRSNTLIKTQLLKQGQSFVEEIIITRQWSANHGGVYVKIGQDTIVNPYLLNIPGVKTVIKDEDGVAYTLKNPALMTREISELAVNKEYFRFKITSLNPLNPNNQPDKFEKTALQSFNMAEHEFFAFEKESDGKAFFRYMVPLHVEKPCLQCHEQQGYKEGEIRGGISVSLPATMVLKQINENRYAIVIVALGIVGLIFAIIRYVAQVFIADMSRAEQKLRQMASYDSLTNLLNRREAFQRITNEIARSARTGKQITFLLCDIDHFKTINDSYGHTAGDMVLKQLADILTTTIRDYDIACRYGGEELLVVAPETSIDQAIVLAERLRTTIATTRFNFENQDISVTVSIGVTQLKEEDTMENALSRADAAMYQAKKDGRNKCCVAD